MEIKLNKRDIYPVATNTANIYAEYEKHLGERNPFAKFNIGAGYYVWAVPGDGWSRLSDASPEEAEEVRRLLLERQKEVAALSNESTASKLFTVPGNNFIFYRLAGPEPRLLLAAWAFKWPKSDHGGHRDTMTVPKPNPIEVAFTFDGSHVPSRPFKLRKPSGQWGDEVTGPTGIFPFASVSVGKDITVKDTPTGKEFTFVVEAGKTLYEFDVTEYVDVRVRVLQDGSPKAGESVHLSLGDKAFDGATLTDGTAVFSLPAMEGKDIMAGVRGAVKTEALSKGGNTIVFEFNTPKPPPPPPLPEDDEEEEEEVKEEEPEDLPEEIEETPPEPPAPPMIRISVVRINGMPMSYATLTMRQPGKPDHKVVLTQNGTTELLPGLFKWNEEIQVDILDGDRKLGPVKLVLEPSEYEYLLQEKDMEEGTAFPWKTLLALLGIAGFCTGLWFILASIFHSL